jgi:tRNA A-37 threonylcarbamoyl transferase component Bud32
MTFVTRRIPCNIDPTLSCRLDALIESGENLFILKKDKRTVVGIVRGDVLGSPHDLCVKRFNYKGFFNFLLKISFGSRAKRLWKISHRLFESGLPVPQPFACIEPSFRVKHSFFISSVIDDSKDLSFIFRNNLSGKREDIALQLGKLMAEWHLAGAVHGDMKWPNIMLQDDGRDRRFFFVDLDQTKIFNRPNISGIKKDLIRFYRSGLEFGAEEWVENSFLPEYSANIGKDISVMIDFASIKSKALNEWHKKGRNRC